MKTPVKIALLFWIAAAIGPATLRAASGDEGDKPAKKEEAGGDKKKKKKKKKNKLSGKASDLAASANDSGDAGAKGELVHSEITASGNKGDWCAWLRGKPGLLHQDRENPWIQSFQIGGRFHYQAAYLEGNDVNGLDFNDHYDEYRRLRVETKTRFLRFFTSEVNVNLVADNRFRDGVFGDLDWGYHNFDEASVEFDIGEAFGDGWLDGIKLKYGRMKLKMSEEVHMSSNEIHTIERSGIADKLGGAASRPTGATLELDKGDWDLVIGIYSAEDDSDFLGGWNDGQFLYGSLEWRASDDLKLVLDYSQNNHDGSDDALGYGWATALSAIYQKNDWGVIGEAIYGDNGGGSSAPIRRRQGDFHAFVVMPWFWIVEDRLQAVVQYQYASSPHSQGLQLPARYVRADHQNPAVDVDNGRGNEHHSLYGGLNYHLCKNRVKFMGGVSYDDLTTRRSEVKALTYQVAFRTAF